MSFRYYNMCENIVVVNALHERNIKRTIFVSKCRIKLKQMQILFHYIFCFQRRYNVNFASFECVQLILQFDIIISLSYAKMHELQQLHDRITSKIVTISIQNFFYSEFFLNYLINISIRLCVLT